MLLEELIIRSELPAVKCKGAETRSGSCQRPWKLFNTVKSSPECQTMGRDTLHREQPLAQVYDTVSKHGLPSITIELKGWDDESGYNG